MPENETREEKHTQRNEKKRERVQKAKLDVQEAKENCVCMCEREQNTYTRPHNYVTTLLDRILLGYLLRKRQRKERAILNGWENELVHRSLRQHRKAREREM